MSWLDVEQPRWIPAGGLRRNAPGTVVGQAAGCEHDHGGRRRPARSGGRDLTAGDRIAPIPLALFAAVGGLLGFRRPVLALLLAGIAGGFLIGDLLWPHQGEDLLAVGDRWPGAAGMAGAFAAR